MNGYKSAIRLLVWQQTSLVMYKGLVTDDFSISSERW